MVSRSAKAEAAAGPPDRRPPGRRPPGRRPPGRRPPELVEETVLVGQVLRPHGLYGEVKIVVLSDVAERFEPGRELWLTAPARAPLRVRINDFRPGTGGALLRLEGWHTREQAESLRGCRLEVGLSEVPEAPEGLFYHHQLIGCGCADELLGELGEVVAVVEDGGGELLEIERPDGHRLLVPFVAAYAIDVDVAGRRIGLRLPPGLLEACES
ncbi:MAG: ribosome maturation factor RimM [Thermoanaerobaculia bacterium]